MTKSKLFEEKGTTRFVYRVALTMAKGRKIQVKETEITIIVKNDTDFISLTDMTLSFKEGSGLISKWITNKNTLEYLGTWEKINNPDFNYPEFGVIDGAYKDDLRTKRHPRHQPGDMVHMACGMRQLPPDEERRRCREWSVAV